MFLQSLPLLALALAVPTDARPTIGAAPTARGYAVHFTLRSVAKRDEVSLTLCSDDDHMSMSHRLPIGALTGLGRAALTNGQPVRFSLVSEPGSLSCAGTGIERGAAGTCLFRRDAEFAGFLAARGIARPTAKESFGLAITGATRSLVQAIVDARYPPPHPDTLIALAAVGVTPAYVAGLSAHGHRPPSLDMLVQYAALGVTPADLDGFARAGYPHLAADEVVQFRALDITPTFIDAFARAGYPHLSPATLVQLKAVGVTPAEARAARQEEGARATSQHLIIARALLGAGRGK